MAKGTSVAGMGDDAQLLAGATLALHEAPRQYADVTRLLNEALDLSFDLDPLFGRPAPHRIFVPSRFVDVGELDTRVTTVELLAQAAGKAKKSIGKKKEARS
jgi:hypothetical protein